MLGWTGDVMCNLMEGAHNETVCHTMLVFLLADTDIDRL